MNETQSETDTARDDREGSIPPPGTENTETGANTDTTAGDASEAEGITVRLWTRRPVSGARTEVIDRLSAFRSEGTIADFEVETWPDEVVVTEQSRHSSVVDVHERFSVWADEAGVSIEPPFDRRTVTSLVGRSEEVLSLPVLCLAVYDGEDLRGVFPCDDGTDTWTVTDYLDACETIESVPAPADLLPPTGD